MTLQRQFSLKQNLMALFSETFTKISNCLEFCFNINLRKEQSKKTTSEYENSGTNA